MQTDAQKPAKVIKFNLHCNGVSIRTIEELQNNFNIDDVLVYFKTNQLQKWLQNRHYDEYAEKVAKLKPDENDMQNIKKLSEIFGLHIDDSMLKEFELIKQYQEEKFKKLGEYSKLQESRDAVRDDYFKNYTNLLNEIERYPNDKERIKVNIDIIAHEYKGLFDMDYRRVFYRLKDISPLAIMCFLMNENTREYFISNKIPLKPADDKETKDKINAYAGRHGITKEQAAKILGISLNINSEGLTMQEKDTAEIYREIYMMIESENFKDTLGDNVISYDKVTDQYWKDLVLKGKRCMILSMGYGDIVRPQGEQGVEYKYDDVHNKFIILDGIDYKSNSNTSELLYMVV